MIIQNINSAAPAPRLTRDSAPAPVVAPGTGTAPVDLPQAAVRSDPTPAQLQSMADNANKAMRQINSNVEFSVDEVTNKTVVKVVESQTGQIVMQIPSEEMLAITRAIDRAQQGILLRQKA